MYAQYMLQSTQDKYKKEVDELTVKLTITENSLKGTEKNYSNAQIEVYEQQLVAKQTQERLQELEGDVKRLTQTLANLQDDHNQLLVSKSADPALRNQNKRLQAEAKIFEANLREFEKINNQLREEIANLMKIHKKELQIQEEERQTQQEAHRREIAELKTMYQKDINALKEDNQVKSKCIEEVQADLKILLQCEQERAKREKEFESLKSPSYSNSAFFEDPSRRGSVGFQDADNNTNLVPLETLGFGFDELNGKFEALKLTQSKK